MKKIEKIILVCLIIAVVVLYALTLRNFKNTNQYDEKMRVSSGNIEYMNDGEWKKLTSVGEVVENNGITTVKDGKEIEICIEDGYLSWNYVGETTKNKLIAITDLIGEKGTDGIDGKDGTNGTNGKNGTDGTNGVNGKDGANGLDGKDGVNGIDGKDGVNGINGEKGEKGEKGDTGDKGDKGEKGEDAIPVITSYLYLKGEAQLGNEEGNLKYDGKVDAIKEEHSKNNGLSTNDRGEIKLDKNKRYLIMYNCNAEFLKNIPKKNFTAKLFATKSGEKFDTVLADIPSERLQGTDFYDVSTMKVITGYESISFGLYCYGGYFFRYDATIFELAD